MTTANFSAIIGEIGETNVLCIKTKSGERFYFNLKDGTKFSLSDFIKSDMFICNLDLNNGGAVISPAKDLAQFEYITLATPIEEISSIIGIGSLSKKTIEINDKLERIIF